VGDLSYSVFRSNLLRDRVVLVTGGGTGIGRAIAMEAAALGATVILAARREEPLRATVEEITAAGGTADWVCLDIRDADAVEETVHTVVERYEHISGLVNNAGGQFPARAEDISPNGWRTVVDLNLNGTFLMTRAVFRASMMEHGGSIVSITADNWRGFPGMAHTGAARAGVVNLTKTLAREWASAQVRVNAVAPGVIDSSGMDTYPPEILALARERVRALPAGRMGTEAEVAGAVIFLLSDAASFMTGQTLRIDGGGSLYSEPLLPMTTEQPIPPFGPVRTQ
jgi:citronellol/citronellal dehydrogenase